MGDDFHAAQLVDSLPIGQETIVADGKGSTLGNVDSANDEEEPQKTHAVDAGDDIDDARIVGDSIAGRKDTYFNIDCPCLVCIGAVVIAGMAGAVYRKRIKQM